MRSKPFSRPPIAGRSSRSGRLRRLALRLLIGLLLLTLAQVLYVRFLPPLFTLTMLERKLEASRAGKPSSLDRSWVDLEDMSPELIRAVLVGEDDQFYEHHGFDLTQIKKAWKANQKGRKVRGASTISQQTARNLFLWQKRSWVRKGLEAYYTVLLELLVPKDRILELYLNVAEWGDRVFGAEAASMRYFKKPAKSLNRTEAAALSASLPNPRKYPPTGSTRFQRRRQALILKRMSRPLGESRRAEPEEQDEDEDEAAEAPTKPTLDRRSRTPITPASSPVPVASPPPPAPAAPTPSPPETQPTPGPIAD